jgi:dihydroorotate dehydrogenase electron transfer subunit
MFQDKLRVAWNTRIGKGYGRIGLICHDRYAHAMPGQFVMFRLPERSTPFLRRPFSIHRLLETGGGTALEILYQVIGDTTRAMSGLEKDGFVDLIGPLGRGFTIPSNAKKVFIAGGGVGVAPLLFLTDVLLKHRVAPEAITVFIGGRSKEDLLCRDDFTQLGIPVVTTTDDGSAGDQCLVTHPLEQAVQVSGPDIIYACGPPGMLSCVAGIAETFDVPCQVSIEAMMACGMGACLGCAVESREGAEDLGRYLHVCMDGPVFEAVELKRNFH